MDLGRELMFVPNKKEISMDKFFLTTEQRTHVLNCIMNVGLSMLGLHVAGMAGVDVAHHIFALPVAIVGVTYVREVIGL